MERSKSEAIGNEHNDLLCASVAAQGKRFRLNLEPNIHIKIHIPPAPGVRWFRSSSIKITPLPTLSPGLRSSPLGSVGGIYHFRQTLQKTKREPPKVRRC